MKKLTRDHLGTAVRHQTTLIHEQHPTAKGTDFLENMGRDQNDLVRRDPLDQRSDLSLLVGIPGMEETLDVKEYV